MPTEITQFVKAGELNEDLDGDDDDDPSASFNISDAIGDGPALKRRTSLSMSNLKIISQDDI